MVKDVVSLEVAQKLQKAGYKGYCEYGWYESANQIMQTSFASMPLVPAPTATQLAEELPRTVNIVHYPSHIITTKCDEIGDNPGKWMSQAYSFVHHTNQKTIIADTFPDALGLMMAYLLENNLIKDEQKI
jgi:hypothetical protein